MSWLILVSQFWHVLTPNRRRAHNPEVAGSKPVVATTIFFLAPFLHLFNWTFFFNTLPHRDSLDMSGDYLKKVRRMSFCHKCSSVVQWPRRLSLTICIVSKLPIPSILFSTFKRLCQGHSIIVNDLTQTFPSQLFLSLLYFTRPVHTALCPFDSLR